jgi:hypothetical protein
LVDGVLGKKASKVLVVTVPIIAPFVREVDTVIVVPLTVANDDSDPVITGVH